MRARGADPSRGGIDFDAERFKMLLLFGAVVLFFVTGWRSWRELPYLFGAKRTQGELIRTQEVLVPAGKGPSRKKLLVEYQFNDEANQKVIARDRVSLGFPVAPTMEVEYLPGRVGSSRLVGNNYRGSVALFCGCLLFLVGTVLWMVREFRRPFPKIRERGTAH